MATATGLAALYFFFMSIVGIFKFLIKKGGRQVTGTVISVSKSQSTSNKKALMYTYDISIDGSTYKYMEETKENAPIYSAGSSIECLVKENNNSVITIDEFKHLKKSLYMNPIYCVVSILATVLLIFIASSI